MRKFCAAVALVSLAVLAVAQTALATINHGNFVGTNVTFGNVSETSTFGDPEPLFEAPTVSGNSLLFSPSNFTATTSGAGGLDQTGALLQTIITSNALTTIDILNFTEFGDATLIGPANAGTGVFA